MKLNVGELWLAPGTVDPVVLRVSGPTELVPLIPDRDRVLTPSDVRTLYGFARQVWRYADVAAAVQRRNTLQDERDTLQAELDLAHARIDELEQELARVTSPLAPPPSNTEPNVWKRVATAARRHRSEGTPQ